MAGRRILSRRGDIHCVLFHVVLMVAYACAFWLYLNPQVAGIEGPAERIAFVVAAAVMLGWGSGINVGVNFHNHIHQPVFRVAWLNRWFGRQWTVSGGWPAYFWEYSHIVVHHDNLLRPSDWTLPKRDVQGRFENAYWYSVAHWPWRYAYHLWKDFRGGRGGPGVGRKALKEFMIFLPLWSIPFWIDWRMALGLWVLPQFFANVAVMGPGMYAQHADCERETVDNPFGHSNTFVQRFFNLTMFNIGYHIEHHDHPTVHWTALPALHERLRDDLIRHRAHVVPFGYYRAGRLLCRRSWVPGQDAQWRANHPDYRPASGVPAPGVGAPTQSGSAGAEPVSRLGGADERPRVPDDTSGNDR